MDKGHRQLPKEYQDMLEPYKSDFWPNMTQNSCRISAYILWRYNNEDLLTEKLFKITRNYENINKSLLQKT